MVDAQDLKSCLLQGEYGFNSRLGHQKGERSNISCFAFYFFHLGFTRNLFKLEIMGLRITYYRNNDGKTLKDLIIQNYVQFREWYLQQEKISKEEFNELFGNEQIKHYLHNNEYVMGDFEPIDKRLIDELTSEFLATYLDLANRPDSLVELVGPCMNKFHYPQSNHLVSATNDHEFIGLWNYIINGRSLKDGSFFNSYTNDNKIGYLSISETKLLKDKIEKYVWNADILSEKHWGLELVLEAINCVDEKNAELIIGIDMDSASSS